MGYWDTPGRSDEWYTPPAVFAALGCRFDLDVAPARFGSDHVPADARLAGCGLSASWHGMVWCNPPFGGRNGIEPWLSRFFAHGDGIALAPDRTSAPWFWSAWRQADTILFTRKIRFLRPDGTEGVSPSNGTALFAAGDRASAALLRAARRGFGILALPGYSPASGTEARRAETLGSACEGPAPAGETPDTTPPGSPDADGAEGRPDHPTEAAARAWVEGEVRGCERLEREKTGGPS